MERRVLLIDLDNEVIGQWAIWLAFYCLLTLRGIETQAQGLMLVTNSDDGAGSYTNKIAYSDKLYTQYIDSDYIRQDGMMAIT